MVRNLKLLLFIILISKTAQSQPAQFSQYIIQLTDKTGSPFSINAPEKFLSKRAIERRKKQNIPVVENDLPVNSNYIAAIENIENVKVLNVSKWFNQIYIQTSDASALHKISILPFVKGNEAVKRVKNAIRLKNKFDDLFNFGDYFRPSGGIADLSYGAAEGQIKIHNGNILHDKGFTGKGMLIALIDDGFYRYLSLPAFDSIRFNHQIIDTFDFVGNQNGLNAEDAHGMYCLSIMASNVPGQMIGSSPGASYLLYRSENVSAEYPGEEQNWIAAAERSDSAGADIITTSLGYNEFDNPIFNYDYDDMNGRTTLMARGAEIAAAKGMIVMIAAGNEGAKPWHYITTPADAENVLTVGAVDVLGNPGSFSSYGPTSDGRIKPDVSSGGVGTYVQAANGTFIKGNGTSFATPNLAGLVACLWQAFPEFNAVEVMDAVKKSSSAYSNPDNKIGYGNTNFDNAFNALSELRYQRRQQQLSAILRADKIKIYPNPMIESATMLVRTNTSGMATLKWYDAGGRICSSQSQYLSGGEISSVPLKRNGLPAGIYFLHFQIANEKEVKKIVLY